MKNVAIYFMALMMFFSQFSQAYDCVGKVNNVVVNAGGVLTLSFGNISWVYLCSVSEPYNGVTPEACKAMLSIAMSAKLSDRNIQLWFSDASNDCTNAAHPAWADLKNWYYGPALL
jgi:hypothetical protein